MPFAHLKLCTQLNQALKQANFTKPTPIQSKVIPLALAKKDVLARSQTGSGKTASFVLPVLEHLHQNPREGKAKVRALILTPNRDLTLQVEQVFKTLAILLPKKPKIVSVIGGESVGEQMFALQKGCDIVVATSGRLLEIIRKQQINLKQLDFFILDEADKMLNLDFAQELEAILPALAEKRQNLLFSATYPEKMKAIAASISNNFTEVSIQKEAPTVQSIHQRAILVNSENRGPLLRHLLKQTNFEQTLVFMANKRATDNIAQKFRKHGFNAESFNGDLSQEERRATLRDFKNKRIRILFATDIAARGLHINDISCVVNFDLPRSPNDYVHRIGRTGRAGKDGVAITFVTHENAQHFGVIEKRAQIKLKKEQIEGFEFVGELPQKQKGPAPVKGKKKSKKDKARELAQKKA